MSVFHDAAITLLGQPTNFVGDVIVWVFTAFLAAMAVSAALIVTGKQIGRAHV